jgi:UDP:flavonoid glycosyltransferase YjiC (YdhE family)
VAFATAASLAGRVESAGFTLLPAGLELDERQARFAPYRAEHLALPLEQRRALLFPRQFGTLDAPARIDDLRAAVTRWQPDLVVHDSADFAAPLAAAEHDLPTVHHSFGRLVPLPIVAAAAAETERLWRDAGLEPEPLGGMFRGICVDITPPSLRLDAVPAGVQVEQLRPGPPTTTPDHAPDWLESLPERPTVYVTLGTVFNELPVIKVLLEGLAGLDCNVIATTGRNRDPGALAPFPANAHVERYIPQALLLPRCSVVVSHSGSGSMLAALAHGLPMLLVPQGADQFDNAAACLAAGVGLRLLPDELTPGAVHSAVVSLLEESSYRECARDVAAEISAMPTPSELVPVLVDELADGVAYD